VSLIDFVKKFKEKTMIIYNGLLSGQRILFVSYEGPCYEISQYVSCCINLVSPLNIIPKIFPFEHLLNLNFLEVKEYIAGVSNPIFSTRKNWSDICCNIGDGTVTVSDSAKGSFKAMEFLGEARLAQLDNEFIQEIIKKIKENDITENQIKRLFYEYTKNFLEYSTNTSNLIDFSKEEKLLLDAFENKGNNLKKTSFFECYQNYLTHTRETLKCHFQESYLDVNKALNDFVEKKVFNDYELLKHYTVLVDRLKTKRNLELFMKIFISRKSDISSLAAGLLCSSVEIQKKAGELFVIFENYENGKNILARFNYFTLFVFENLKIKYQLKQD